MRRGVSEVYNKKEEKEERKYTKETKTREDQETWKEKMEKGKYIIKENEAIE